MLHKIYTGFDNTYIAFVTFVYLSLFSACNEKKDEPKLVEIEFTSDYITKICF